MLARFQRVWPGPSRLVNLRDFAFAGGCLGCFRCAATGECFYRDGFSRLLREEIQSADATPDWPCPAPEIGQLADWVLQSLFP